MAIITYFYPVSSVGTPPSKAAVFGHNKVIASIVPELYDSAIVVTHNMQIPAADLAAGFPEVEILPLSLLGSFELAPSFISSRTENTVVFTVSDPASSVDKQFLATITRPQSKFK